MDSKKIKKVLLMGKKEAGKTSMHSIIFANVPPKDTIGIGFTTNIQQNKFGILYNLTLNLWDCAGQKNLMHNYLNQQQDIVFTNVQALIYVFDVQSNQKEYEEELESFSNSVNRLQKYTPGAMIFVLIHKMDTIKHSERAQIYEAKRKDIDLITQQSNLKNIFQTSIWDDTLYKAWSNILQHLIPNIESFQSGLRNFCENSGFDEVVLFERQTFLTITQHEKKNNQDITKYERLSNIIKQFKLTCKKALSSVSRMQYKTKFFTAYMDGFTDNTFILVINYKSDADIGIIEFNIEQARELFKNKEGADSEKLDMLK